jgi:hypothetical protein
MNYPPGMTLRPLDGWPNLLTPTRRRAPFKSSFGDTVTMLKRELRMLDPDDPKWPDSVLQVALREKDFRLDGMPRANVVHEHPGVILNIDSRTRKSLSFPCDTFMHWHDNLRAIALTLEALRKVDRYGVTQTGQQYRGWQAIEPKPATIDAVTSACIVLARVAWPNENDEAQARWASKIATDSEIRRNTLRQARVRAHPDKHNGDGALSNQVEGAADVLRRSGIEIN